MGKNKVQPYQLFVKDEFNRLKRAGQNVIFQSLFIALDSKWKSLSEEKRLWYKERAANGGQPVGGPPRQQQPAPPPTSQQPSHQSDTKQPQPSKSNFCFSETKDSKDSMTNNGENMDVKMDFSYTNSGADVKPDIDVKPVIKEERGVKRELDLDIAATRQEREQEQPNKKTKNIQGFGIPNWRNIKNSNSPDADRYFDFHLHKLRVDCESIVMTRASTLLDAPMYVFSCNVLCKYKKDGKEIKFIPIEIGIHAYSIRKGQLKPPYHVIIDSGPPPRNYWGDTSDHMIENHKIKVTQSGEYPPEARKDYKKIYKEMTKYTRDGERTILVADNYDLEQVRKSIEWIYEMACNEPVFDDLNEPSSDAKLRTASSWTILPLVDYVAAAHRHVYVDMLKYPLPKPTLHYFLKVRLETSVWDYEVDLMCPYHRKEENQTKWCARSCAIRAINALNLTLEEIHDYYLTAEEAEKKAKEARDNMGRSESSTGSAQKRRTPAQQMQQPLHMPEETQPPPVFEKVIRQEEMRRQQEEAMRYPPPPEEDYNAPPPQHQQDSNNLQQPLAIEPAPHRVNVLDPRIRRQANDLNGPAA